MKKAFNKELQLILISSQLRFDIQINCPARFIPEAATRDVL